MARQTLTARRRGAAKTRVTPHAGMQLVRALHTATLARRLRGAEAAESRPAARAVSRQKRGAARAHVTPHADRHVVRVLRTATLSLGRIARRQWPRKRQDAMPLLRLRRLREAGGAEQRHRQGVPSRTPGEQHTCGSDSGVGPALREAMRTALVPTRRSDLAGEMGRPVAHTRAQARSLPGAAAQRSNCGRKRGAARAAARRAARRKRRRRQDR